MELELKHLAPYLPYKLKIYHEALDGAILPAWTLHYNGIGFILGNQNMPILRPMMDLRNDKESIVELKLFVHADLLWTIDGAINGSYESVQYLLSKHYDVFELIGAGLAIDINTLK